MKADGIHVDFIGFVVQYLEVYVCIMVYLTYVATIALIGEIFFVPLLNSQSYCIG